MKEFLEKTLRQNVIMTENKEVYKKLPLAYCGRYDIFTVETNGVLWMAIHPKDDAGLVMLRRDRAGVEKMTGLNCAIFLDRTTFYIKEKMMEEVNALMESKKAAVKDASEETAEDEKEDEAVIDIEPKEEITYEDFSKMQFQVGEIISCEAVKKSKKLLCSQVKIGSQVKQIVSGIKAHYTPEEMVGKKVMVLVNLKPAKLAGVLSEGMLLCAEDADGNLALMTPEKKMPAGAEIC